MGCLLPAKFWRITGCTDIGQKLPFWKSDQKDTQHSTTTENVSYERVYPLVPRTSLFLFLLLRILPKLQCDCGSHLTRRGEPPTDRHSWAPRFRPLFVSEQFCPLFVSELPSSLHERWRMRCKNWFLLETFVNFWGELLDVFLSEWFTVCWTSSILVSSRFWNTLLILIVTIFNLLSLTFSKDHSQGH